MSERAESLGWASVTELARLKGLNKSAISRRVARLEARGMLTARRGAGGAKLINVAEFDRVAAETTDGVRELNGRGAAPAGAAQPGIAGEPSLSRMQMRRTAFDAELKRLDLEERRGNLVRVVKVEDALARAGETIVRIVDQLPMETDDLGTAWVRNGAHGLRGALKDLARRMRTRIADSLNIDDEPSDPGPAA